MSKSKSTASRSNKYFLLALAIVALCSLGIRISRLAERPFHCDEAVQAVKFGNLLEEGHYEYDPQEYHGPSLYYLSLPIAWINGVDTLAEMNESQLRLLPVLFGTTLILLLVLAVDGIGWGGVLWAALLTGISPFMVYFSRYYIQEMLLVFFSASAILCAWRYSRKRKAVWSVFTGVSLGMMFATKETCILSWFALVMALLLVLLQGKKLKLLLEIPISHLALAVFSAAFMAALFFSSFGTHPAGVIEAILAFPHYFTRAGGEGHAYPWYNYLRLLFWHREQGVLWSELLILIPAIYGGVRAFLPRFRADSGLSRFLVFYTLILTVLYSAIPYKTPWLALGFLQPAIMLAGLGLAELWRDLNNVFARFVFGIAILLALVNLAQQTWRGSFYYAADERNPCAYSHTSKDLVRFVDQLHRIVALAPDAKATGVKIVAPEYWPLPWYLRDFENVGYWHTIPTDPEAPVIITSPEYQEAIDDVVKGDYFKVLAGLRPGVVIYAMIRQDLWDAYLKEMAGVEQ